MNRFSWISFLVVGTVLAPLAGAQDSGSKKQQRQTATHTAEFFDDAHDALESALALYDRQEKLPAKKDLAFYDFLSHTKESQRTRVDGYLDVAAEALGISKINQRRDRIAQLRNKIAKSRSNITIYQRRKISAPESTYNPLNVSKSGYDKKISTEKTNIKNAQAQIESEKRRLVRDLEKIGMTISSENVDILLESITGDEFVRISIIFDNAKNFARELERLTDQTGEDLAAAKKYYGVYLMLLQTIDRLQNKFVENVENVYYPRLDEYAKQAQKNVESARKAIKLGGDPNVLENNIDSNLITYDAAMYYKRSLSKQKYEMKKANQETRKNILTARNTYQTATLSKNLSSLIAVSRRAFESITELSVPDLRPFENAKLKEEFSRITEALRSSDR